MCHTVFYMFALRDKLVTLGDFTVTVERTMAFVMRKVWFDCTQKKYVTGQCNVPVLLYYPQGMWRKCVCTDPVILTTL